MVTPRSSRLLPTLGLVLLLAGCGGTQGRRGGPFAGDSANATFMVAGQEAKLAGGRATIAGADGAQTEIQLTEGRLEGDLDEDGVTDLLVVVAHDVAGEGATFHLAALISDQGGGYRAVPSVLLGDRLVVKNLGFEGQDIKLRLVVRDPNNADPRPSKVVERRFRFAGGALQALDAE